MEVVIVDGPAEMGALVAAHVVARISAEPDALVGERGVLTGTARSATVTATSHLGVHVLSTERLRSIMESNPAAAAQMRDVVARYGSPGD